MAQPSRSSELQPDLAARVAALGRSLGEREASHRAGLEAAGEFARALRKRVATALERFHEATARSGAPHLRVSLGELRTDDKHLRAVQFDLTRGRHRAIVTAKGRGEITFVGPFSAGKAEGPCLTLPFESEAEVDETLAVFLERFLEAAATP